MALVEKTKALVALKKEIDSLKLELKELEKSYESIGDEVTELMGAEGMQSMNIDGKVVYLQRKKRISLNKEHKQAAIRFAQTEGMDAMVTLQPQALGAFVREALEIGDLDPTFESYLNIFDQDSVGVRQA